VYPLNGLFTCGWEFWIMGIWLPFGMALFQGVFNLSQCTSDHWSLPLYSWKRPSAFL
jgi:hypothetical protein